jgi:leader peptidase (prepilin peptidase)/N-methyltransferase
MDDALLAYGWLGLAAAIWLGLCVGSFLNVVVYRLPVMLNRQWRAEATEFLEGEAAAASSAASTGSAVAPASDHPATPEAGAPFNLMVPRSRCPNCGHQIRAWENVPVLSWLALRGRCSACANPIPVRYPLVELLTGIVSIVVLATFGFTWIGAAALGFTWILLALTFIDFDTQLLPDQLTLPLLWFGLLVNVLGGFTEPATAIVGAAAGYLCLWSIYWGFKLLTGKEGMGYGDFKLLGAIGAWLGWQVLPATLMIAACVGLVYALGASIAGRRQSGHPIPFGPFLAVAGWIALIQRDRVLTLFVPG